MHLIKCPNPNCGSENIIFSKKKQIHICEDCNQEFIPQNQIIPLRIFISYGRDEYAGVAEKLKGDLEARGHAVWFDKDRLKEGGDWERYIEEGLNWVASDITTGRVVFIMTPHSTRRPDGYCLNEIAKAVMNNVSVVPIMVLFCEPPLSICRVQWLDMRDCIPLDKCEGIYASKFDRLITALEAGKLDFEGVQNRLLTVLKPIEFSADIVKHMLAFTGRRWIFQEIDNWFSSASGSRIFWILGAPGVGKSAISAWLRDNRREISAFHFCACSSMEKGDPAKLVASIAYQLSTQLPDYQTRLAGLNLEWIMSEYKDALTLFDILVVQPLLSIPKPDRTVTILIDALDEASKDGRNDLASFISSEFSKTPDWLKLFITSRPDPEIMGPLQGLRPYVFDTSTEHNILDIRDYLKEKLRRYANADYDISIIVEEILLRSEGLFLYAERVCEDLHNGNLSVDHLSDFPRGLGGVYDRYFRRQFADITYYRERIRPLLGVIMAAVEPLEMELLSAVYGWDDEAFNDIILSLGSLFTKSNGRMQAYHRSLIDWLGDKDKAFHYYVSVKEGHRKLAEATINCDMSRCNHLGYVYHYGPYHLACMERWDDFLKLVDMPVFEAGCAFFVRELLVSAGENMEPLLNLVKYAVRVDDRRITDLLLREIETVIALGHLDVVKTVLPLIVPICISHVDKARHKFLQAWILSLQGNLGASIALFEQIDVQSAGCYGNRIAFHYANAIRESGDYVRARTRYQDLFLLKKDAKDGESILFAQQYADVLYVQGQHHSARSILIDLAREFPDNSYPIEIGEVYRIHGHILRMNEVCDEAEGYYIKALKLFGDIGNIFGQARIETNLAETFAVVDPDRALVHGKKAIKLNRTLSIPIEIGKSQNAIGLAYLMRGELDLALDMFKAALDTQSAVGYRSGVGMVLSNILLAHLLTKDLKQAMATFHDLVELFEILDVYPILVYRSALLLSVPLEGNLRIESIKKLYSDKMQWLNDKVGYNRRVLKIYGRFV